MLGNFNTSVTVIVTTTSVHIVVPTAMAKSDLVLAFLEDRNALCLSLSAKRLRTCIVEHRWGETQSLYIKTGRDL